jgi:hypothetical protein
LPELKQKVKERERRIRGLEQGVKLQAEIETLKKEMAWAQIAEMEEVSCFRGSKATK